MPNTHDANIAALNRWLDSQGIKARVECPGDISCEPIPGGIALSGGADGGELRLELTRPPNGALTLGEASWKEGTWVEIPDDGELSLPSPAALVMAEGALALAAERRWTAEAVCLRKSGQVVEVPIPPATEGQCWLTHGDTFEALSAIADAMMTGIEGASPPRGPLFGWMSWDELRFDLTEGDVVENAVTLTDRLGGGDAIVLVDDGWQRAAGDWEPHETFAHGMLWLTDRIHRLGAKAGLWIAPFLVALRSPLGLEHPAWLLRDDSGGPLVELDNTHWGGKTGTLDPTRPEVLDWLRALGERVRQWEFDYLKMDFLAHALTGRASVDSMPRGEAYRAAIRAIQAGLGPAMRTMGCGTPLLAARGLFDAVRVDDDVVTDWSLLRSRLSSVAVRAALHRRWWRADPDNVLLREPFTLDQGRLWASIVSMTGGSVFLGDDLRRLDEERWETARRIWPPVDIEAQPLGLMNPASPVEHPAGDGWVARVENPWGTTCTVALVNWEAKPCDRFVHWRDLGLDLLQRCHVWELWSDTPRGIAVEELQSRVPGQSCEVLAITPVRDHPQIIGSTRHVVVGAVGIDQVEWNPGNASLTGMTTQHLPGAEVRLTVAAPAPWKRAAAEGMVLQEISVSDEHTLFTLCATREGPWALRFS